MSHGLLCVLMWFSILVIEYRYFNLKCIVIIICFKGGLHYNVCIFTIVYILSSVQLTIHLYILYSPTVKRWVRDQFQKSINQTTFKSTLKTFKDQYDTFPTVSSPLGLGENINYFCKILFVSMAQFYLAKLHLFGYTSGHRIGPWYLHRKQTWETYSIDV